MIKNFPVSPAPHLRDAETSSAKTWRFVFALIPLCIVLFVQHPLEAGRTFGAVLAAAFLTDAAFSFALKKKADFQDGSLVLWALLLSLLLPPDINLVCLLLFSSAAVFLGKAFYGGRMGVWAHPAWLGYALFILSISQAGKAEAASLFFWNPFTDLWSILMTAALFLGGLFLVIRKNTAWETPLLYLLLVLIPCILMDLETRFSLPLILLNAFWVLADSAVVPCSRRGRIYFSIAAALLTLVLDLLSAPSAPVFAVLILNSLTPWMDEWILPQGISFEAHVRTSPEAR